MGSGDVPGGPDHPREPCSGSLISPLRCDQIEPALLQTARSGPLSLIERCGWEPMANTVESPGEKLKVFISYARSDGAALAED